MFKFLFLVLAVAGVVYGWAGGADGPTAGDVAARDAAYVEGLRAAHLVDDKADREVIRFAGELCATNGWGGALVELDMAANWLAGGLAYADSVSIEDVVAYMGATRDYCKRRDEG